jgi:hypothetical protein
MLVVKLLLLHVPAKKVFYGDRFGGTHLTALFSIQDGRWLEVIIYGVLLL